MNTLIIGPRASGKTTIGRLLASRLRATFIDLDEATLARFPGQSVQEIWSRQGERAWRIAEKQALEEVLRSDEQVVALGGGTPMIEGARDLINDQKRSGRAQVIYLVCEISVLQARLRAGAGDRPSLTGSEVADEVAAVLAQREHAYKSLANLQIDTSVALPAVTVEGVVRMLAQRPRR